MSTVDTKGRLNRLNLQLALPPLLVAATFLVVKDASAWWHVPVLVVGFGAGLLVFFRWAAQELAAVWLPGILVAGIVWPVGAWVMDTPNAYWGLMVAASLSMQLTRRRLTASFALLGYIVLVGLVKLALTPEITDEVLIGYLGVPVGVTVVVCALMFPNREYYDVIKDLEEARDREAELAVARERIRFAGDLHDIQGHTLHVVKLKVMLAGRLVRTDPERAEAELEEIHTLVSDTITQTKELAHAQRRLNLAAELENAKNLFEAAGIRVRVVREAEADPRAGEMLGQVLRETTTNILRHAQATEVRVTLSERGISIVNDGIADDPPSQPPELRGLDTLRQRLADDGGQLRVEQKEGLFTTAAEVAPHQAGAR